MNLFTLLLICVVDIIILIYGQGAFGRDDYSVAGMWVLLFASAVTFASVGLTTLQKNSPRISFNGSEQAWSFSGKYFSCTADGKDWVLVRIGSGFQAGVGRLFPMDGNNTVCMLKKRVRWGAWPYLFSHAYYIEQSSDYARVNYPELYQKVIEKYGASSKFWIEDRYNPLDELNILGSTDPDTNKPLSADDIKADIKIGSLSGSEATIRNTIITDMIGRKRELNGRIGFAVSMLEKRDAVISKTLINATGALSDIQNAKKRS